MNQDYKDLIIKHFVKLMKHCNVESLKDPLIQKGVFKEREFLDIFSTDDIRHNKRMFFFRIQDKHGAWIPFLEALRETNQNFVVDMFLRKGATVFNPIMNSPETEEIPQVQELSKIAIPLDTKEKPLKVKVMYSTDFYDTFNYNGRIDFYKSRSKKRGRVLIINNYEFLDENKNPYRNGAKVDEANLIDLFQQMGGWDIVCHSNIPTLQMDYIIKNFANYENSHLYDICFIIIMSHGSGNCNDTLIYGIDGNPQTAYISVSTIEKLFSNENCKVWRGKPKVIMVPICRGSDRQLPIQHKRTETDSISPNVVATNTPNYRNLRPDDDMLICFSTSFGYTSHRDKYRGTWYIELLCQELMNHAHNLPINDILMLVNQGLSRRMSENHTMQTPEFINRGFKRLYLHPGLYFENDNVKKYDENNL